MARGLGVGDADDEALAEDFGGAGDGFKGDGGIARVEQAVELGTAGAEFAGRSARSV